MGAGMRFIPAALAAVLLIGGCGAIGNREGPENASASPPPSEGTVVISTGAAAPCFQASTFLVIAPLGQTYFQNKLPFNHVHSISVDVWAAKSDFSDHQGNISVLNLPAGDYEMYTWLAGNFVPIRIPYAEFTVEAGKAVYIGEYYMDIACRANTLGGFRDREDRDLSFVRQKNPAFASVVFDKRIARFVGYIVDNKQ
jgi:hypothetical protein